MTRKIEIKCPIKCALPRDYKLLTQELEVLYYLNEDPAITYLQKSPQGEYRDCTNYQIDYSQLSPP
jgi:hypothetical protein